MTSNRLLLLEGMVSICSADEWSADSWVTFGTNLVWVVLPLVLLLKLRGYSGLLSSDREAVSSNPKTVRNPLLVF